MEWVIDQYRILKVKSAKHLRKTSINEGRCYGWITAAFAAGSQRWIQHRLALFKIIAHPHNICRLVVIPKISSHIPGNGQFVLFKIDPFFNF
jgi:hypothetical protein